MNKEDRKIVLELKDIHKSFGKNHVLKGFNLKLYEGENLVIMGKSGSGKSVMVKSIVGLIQPDSGSITIKDHDIITMGQEELDFLRTEIGFLFQGSALYDSMTVRENLEFPLRRHKDKVKNFEGTEKSVTQALESVGLLHAIDLMPAELSGGMMRRVALARALILKPEIIMYDEPTAGLDPITSNEIIQLMRTIQKEYNTSSLIITHDVDCARVISNRIILLVDGINYAEGTYDELSTSSDPQTRAFFKN
ncbi:ATP-binding cassette domain-containing protein [Brumimicrobium glaciale]|jgi:phospholipid/cholesterol/gamma-HCH transport system ATP-binding protein|uniref:ATP-binding cassette domain-containing protein n=1 Tax=Brumimicrobium glaciale TaxID=200475 RepID=A0A4Q4KVG9_9FLAO|nr:ATP-binding cassette domain-containing protein [Brumimicrobium glaciale]RYM36094.1 ATP-binding cassette domain-containing protein [Brumimicrobium glaciale]